MIHSKEGPYKNDSEALKWFKEAATPKGSQADEEDAKLFDEETLRIAQYALGVTLITGNTNAAFKDESFSFEDEKITVFFLFYGRTHFRGIRIF